MDSAASEKSIIALDRWLQSPAGAYVRAWEQACLDELTVDIFGFNAVQIGVPQIDALAANRMPNKWQAATRTSTARAYVTMLDAGTEAGCLALAQQLRKAGVPAEIALEAGKLGNQIKYADRKGIDFVVIVGKNELAARSCSVDAPSSKVPVSVTLSSLAAQAPSSSPSTSTSWAGVQT